MGLRWCSAYSFQDTRRFSSSETKVTWISCTVLGSQTLSEEPSFFVQSRIYVVLFLGKKVQERICGSGTHYHNLCCISIQNTLKYTNKQSLGRKGVGTAFPRVPTEKALQIRETNNSENRLSLTKGCKTI